MPGTDNLFQPLLSPLGRRKSSSYTWSPDNQIIAYQTASTIYWYDFTLQSWNQTVIPATIQSADLQSWLPKDNKILMSAYSRNSQFWELDLSSQTWTLLDESTSMGP